ncbi:MAG: hypothetical protein ACOCWC_01870 [Bacteroidota bacterium]
MKTIIKAITGIIVTASFLCSTNLNAQDYHTIRVNGTILLEKTNAMLERGTVFNEEDPLVFKTYNSIATVISPENGRFVLRPDNTDLAYAKASYTPAMSNISSRSSELMTVLDMKNHFNGKYVLFDKVNLKMNPDAFPMDEDNFFYIQYVYNNEKINKKLSFKDNYLILNKDEIFKVDGNSIEQDAVSEMEVWYMQRNLGNKNTLLGSFEPVIIDNQELANEITIIFEVFEEKSYEEKVNEALSFINEFYGTPDRESLEEWIKENIDM